MSTSGYLLEQGVQTYAVNNIAIFCIGASVGLHEPMRIFPALLLSGRKHLCPT